MVTHDVDEATPLSNRKLLMSSGPEPQIMEEIDVAIPRPRVRTTIVGHAAYDPVRNRITRFLSATDVAGPSTSIKLVA